MRVTAPRLLPSLVWLLLAFGAVSYTLEVFFSLGHLTWVLCAVSFGLNGVSLILHLVHGTLKRRLAVDRVIVCVNVAALSAAALTRDNLPAKTFWAVSAGVPLVSWYCFWACHAATAMPSAGEALRPAKDLAQCHPVNKLAVVFVLLGEYFQFNSLPFNPDLGFWTDMPSFSALFEASFLIFQDEPRNHSLNASAPSGVDAADAGAGAGADGDGALSVWYAPGFEDIFWYCTALGVGWTLFAALFMCRLTALRRRQAWSADYTMGHPAYLAVLLILTDARGCGRWWWRRLAHCHSCLRHASWKARRVRPALLAPLALLPLALCTVAAAVALVCLTLLLLLGVVACVGVGLCLVLAFQAITLLHFPIMMQVLSVLHCDYSAGGDTATMHRLPSQLCWQGEHIRFVFVGIVVLAVIYPMMILFERRRQSAAEISYHVRFTSFILIGKLLLSAVSTLFVIDSPYAYLLVCFLLLLFFLHVNNEREQDSQPACCNVRSVRLARSLVLCTALWSCGVTVVTPVLPLLQPALAAVLVLLHLLSLGYFGVLLYFPQHEPRYLNQAPQLTAGQTAAAAAAAAAHDAASACLPAGRRWGTPRRDPAAYTAVSPVELHCAAAVQSSPSHGHIAADARRNEAHHQPPSPPPPPPPPPHASPPGGPRWELTPLPLSQLELLPRDAEGDAEEGARACGEQGLRAVRVAREPGARPAVDWFMYDDGFDAETRALKQEGDRLLPVVMAVQGGDAGLTACDVVIEVDGERGLSAEDTKRRLEQCAGPPLQLLVRRAALRSKGCKLGPPAAQLEGMAVRTLVQCLMLYPQDAALQYAGCAVLRGRLEMAAATPDARRQLTQQASALLLPVAINALEVHRSHADVQAEVANMLAALAEHDGEARANMVAAGVLPAVRATLTSRRLATDVEVVAAMCGLCQVLVSRRALAGSRRALCEALAATGAVAAALHALRRHASDERVAIACCALLSAFHDVFDREPTPLPFRRALADAGTLAALEEVLEQHAHNPTIGFATKWALKVGQEAAAVSADPQRAEERLAAKENQGGDQHNRARDRRGRRKGAGAA